MKSCYQICIYIYIHDLSNWYWPCGNHMCDAFICMQWRIHTCGMTPSHVWHDLFICVTRPNYNTYPYEWLHVIPSSRHIFFQQISQVNILKSPSEPLIYYVNYKEMNFENMLSDMCICTYVISPIDRSKFSKVCSLFYLPCQIILELTFEKIYTNVSIYIYMYQKTMYLYL